MTMLGEPSSAMMLKVRRLEAKDAVDFRDLRLEALKAHPEAFGSSWDAELGKPATSWRETLEANAVFGGWVGSSPLAGMAGFHIRGGAKLQHKGVLWGMYLRPQARGTGLAGALVDKVIEHARLLVEDLTLSVVASNMAAQRLYRAAGFEQYGLERRALKVGAEYHDELLMTLSLRPPAISVAKD